MGCIWAMSRWGAGDEWGKRYKKVFIFYVLLTRMKLTYISHINSANMLYIMTCIVTFLTFRLNTFYTKNHT